MNTDTPRPPRAAKLADPRVALVAANVALLLVLGVVTLAPTADAQQSQRPRGEYIVLGGQMTGAPTKGITGIGNGQFCFPCAGCGIADDSSP
ncbi:MAG: hypothetical protein AAFV77_13690, partial [Planctomycetota bacterium]